MVDQFNKHRSLSVFCFLVFFLKRSGGRGVGCCAPLNPRKRKAEARGPPRSPPSFPSSCGLSNQREFLSLWFPTCFRHNLRTRVGGSSGLQGQRNRRCGKLKESARQLSRLLRPLLTLRRGTGGRGLLPESPSPQLLPPSWEGRVPQPSLYLN